MNLILCEMYFIIKRIYFPILKPFVNFYMFNFLTLLFHMLTKVMSHDSGFRLKSDLEPENPIIFDLSHDSGWAFLRSKRAALTDHS